MAVQLDVKQAPSWIQWITDYNTTRKLFLDNWHALKELRPWVAEKHPELLKQHDAMMKKFMDQVPAIDNLERLRIQVEQFLSGAGVIGKAVGDFASGVGSSVQSGMEWLGKRFGLGELGLAPVVWVAISVGSAGAALATIASLVKEAYVYSTRLNALKEAEERGATPEQAAAIVNQVLGKPGTSAAGKGNLLGIPFETLALAAVAVFLGPPLLKMISERRS